MTKKTPAAARTVWPVLPVSDMADQVHGIEADADLIASVRSNGIEEPLFVAVTARGMFRVVDGLRRLAAAVAVQLTEVPVTYRPMIRVDHLTRHPDNVRADLRITRAFRASVREHIEVPLSITRTGGAMRVVDGHRRLAAAIAEKVTHVPYEYVDRDDAAQFLTMVSTATHREALTTGEEAAALFSAERHGATVKQLATASGRTQGEARTLARIGGSAAVAAVTQASDYEWTLDELAELAELDATAPEAAARVRDAVKANPNHSHHWTIRNETTRVATGQRAQEHRTRLQKDGAAIRTVAELSEKATPVRRLSGVTDHSGCQGDVWVLETGDPEYTRYCTSPALYGHQVAPTAGRPSSSERKAVITGNQHWDTAQTLRREWLTGIIGRKRQPKALTDQFLTIATRVMLGASSVIASKLCGDKTSATLADLLGVPKETGKDRRKLAERATGSRKAAHLFATVAAAFEEYMPRTTWRVDSQYADGSQYGHGGTRTQARLYLGWLTELGYEPTAIESAVMADEMYRPGIEAAADEDETGAAE
ncbi:ParB N-terminal domain-containing protein [Streptomyces sp. NPDC087850]|uniref:ParB N-terminal domain-containing protein n=1 Tax=Streptomyces sp. NPDC087850 TaxID=3365809 RepID=UPI00382FE945